MKKPEIRFGRVVSTKDETGAGRIKVAIAYEDSGEKIAAMENDKTAVAIGGNNVTHYAFPFLPKFFHVIPKVGEGVFIINQALDESHSQRYYLGPIIAQPQFMYNNDYFTSTRLLSGTLIGADENPEYKRETPGTLPDKTDVAVLGRKDSDIILKEDEIHVRCGVKNTTVLTNDSSEFEFNGKHPAFIKLKHFRNIGSDVSEDFQTQMEKRKEQEERGYESVANIVADKINLIGTDSRDIYKVNDPEKLISDEEMDRFIKKAHQVPYGDTLLEFLNIFKTAFLTHQHRWAQLPPVVGEDVKRLTDYPLNTILSQTVRIN